MINIYDNSQPKNTTKLRKHHITIQTHGMKHGFSINLFLLIHVLMYNKYLCEFNQRFHFIIEFY